MTPTLNLTGTPCTPEMLDAGVVDLPADLLARLQRALSFDDIPVEDQIYERVSDITRIIRDAGGSPLGGTSVLLGGNHFPALLAALHFSLAIDCGISVRWAFAKTVHAEVTLPNGTKTGVPYQAYEGSVSLSPEYFTN